MTETEMCNKAPFQPAGNEGDRFLFGGPFTESERVCGIMMRQERAEVQSGEIPIPFFSALPPLSSSLSLCHVLPVRRAVSGYMYLRCESACGR